MMSQVKLCPHLPGKPLLLMWHASQFPCTVQGELRGGPPRGEGTQQGRPPSWVPGQKPETQSPSPAGTGTYGKIWESSTKCSIDNFIFIKVLGKGSFGKVRGPTSLGQAAQGTLAQESRSTCLPPSLAAPG